MRLNKSEIFNRVKKDFLVEPIFGRKLNYTDVGVLKIVLIMNSDCKKFSETTQTLSKSAIMFLTFEKK